MINHIQINEVAPRIRYDADGVQSAFTFPFAIFKVEDLEVWQGEVRQFGGFAVSGAGISSGGTVLFAVPPEAGTRITLRRRLGLGRVTDYQADGIIRAKTLNDELDYQVAAVQQVADDVSHCVHRPFTSGNTASLALPEPAAGKALGWSADGTALVNDPADFAATVANVAGQSAQVQVLAEAAAVSAATAATARAAAQTWAELAQSSVGATRVSGTDTIARPLADSLAAGAHVALTIDNPGGDETLRIDVAGLGALAGKDSAAPGDLSGLPSGTLLGRGTDGIGAAETLILGAGLSLAGGVLSCISSLDAAVRDQLALTNLRLLLSSSVSSGALMQGYQWELASDEWAAGNVGYSFVTGDGINHYRSGGTLNTIFLAGPLSSLQSWIVPFDWNSANNSVECIGGGASGGCGGVSNGAGGAGGTYAKSSNLTLTPGASINYQIGAGGAAITTTGNGNAGGATWFGGTTLASSTVGAQGGAAGSDNMGGVGAINLSVGQILHSGGSGGNSNVGGSGGGGGGGAGGRRGNGGNGGDGANSAGGGGGGSGGGTSGTNGGNGSGAAISNTGGNGGNNAAGTGTIGIGGGHYVSGTGGTNGAGGGGSGNVASGTGGTGGAGTDHTATAGGTAGPGGGGGGAFGTGTNAGSGGLYGGGGGGVVSGGASGGGAQGIIVITYTTASEATLTSPTVSVPSAPSIMVGTCLYRDDSGNAVLGSDLIVELSRDGGTSWTAATLNVVAAYDGSYSVLKARANVGGQPLGTAMKARIKTFNTKAQRIAAPALYTE